uniref:hypothetical protein n=1 Tax=Rhizobium rhizogenes TaxID=359 RepID=UPI0019104830|nr:hypothetical protein [Rhizobium rhizogenes]
MRAIIAQLGHDRHGKARRDLAGVERFDVAKLIFDGAPHMRILNEHLTGATQH